MFWSTNNNQNLMKIIENNFQYCGFSKSKSTSYFYCYNDTPVFLPGGHIPCRIRTNNKQTKQSQLCSVQRRPYLYGYLVLVRYVAHPISTLPILLLCSLVCGFIICLHGMNFSMCYGSFLFYCCMC